MVHSEVRNTLVYGCVDVVRARMFLYTYISVVITTDVFTGRELLVLLIYRLSLTPRKHVHMRYPL